MEFLSGYWISLIFLVLASLIDVSYSQLVSPCPRLFKYETNTSEKDRWYGTLTLLSDVDLAGVWLRIVLDKPTTQLGNWFGEVERRENNEYLIKNRNVKLAANTPQDLRFYVKYTPGETPPRLIGFRLNARTVCPEGGTTTQAPVTTGLQFTSTLLSSTSNPNSGGGGGNNFGGNNAGSSPVATGGSTVVRPGGAFNIARPGSSATEEDDFFQGDFSLLNGGSRPTPTNFGAACGTVVTPPKPLITHGQATHEGEFPWHAAIYYAKGIDLTYICGGSLISKYHVITVAHCVTRRKSQRPVEPDTIIIYLGKYYLRRWSGGVQDHQVESITTHPNYNSELYSNDLAIVKFKEPAEVTNYVRPVCLWEGNIELQNVINKEGSVVGWGYDENGRVTEELTKANMPIVSQETCIYSFPDFFSRFTSTKTFCAGYRNDYRCNFSVFVYPNGQCIEQKEITFLQLLTTSTNYWPMNQFGTSVCNGDSGGGMVFPKQTSDGRTTVWQLRGLVSISVALQNTFKCDSSHYVVFTDIAKYLDWIQANLR